MNVYDVVVDLLVSFVPLILPLLTIKIVFDYFRGVLFRG